MGELMEKLLLHACCGPCATSVIEKLMRRYDVICYFYNPNIHPKEEFIKRRDSFISVMKKMHTKYFLHDYEPYIWFEKIKGFEKDCEGARRCALCFELRLCETARKAYELEIEKITTTLTVSPYKSVDMIFEIGKKCCKKYGIKFIDMDFKKKHGFQRSVEMSKKMNLYRQRYCGCIFSYLDRKEIERGRVERRQKK